MITLSTHKQRSWLAIVFWLVALSGMGAESVNAEKTETLFRYRFQPGRTFVYDLSVTGSVTVETPKGPASNPIEISMEILQTHGGESKDGTTVDVEIAKARMVSGSDSAPLPEEGTKASFTQDERGVTKTLSGSASYQGSAFAGLIFPLTRLKTGEGWVQDAADPSLPGKSRMIYRLIGNKLIGSATCALFGAEMQIDRGSMPSGSEASSKGSVCFDPALGQVVEIDVDSVFAFPVPVPDQGIMVRSKTSIRTVMRLREVR